MSIKLAETQLSKGNVLVELEGLGGEDDFYKVFDLMNSLLQPETSRTSIDSLCVMGTFCKDGISVRMSSEGLNDWVAFQYNASELSADEAAKVMGWIQTIADAI